MKFKIGAPVLLRKFPVRDPGIVLRISREKLVVVDWHDGRIGRHEPQDLMLDHGYDDEDL